MISVFKLNDPKYSGSPVQMGRGETIVEVLEFEVIGYDPLNTKFEVV